MSERLPGEPSPVTIGARIQRRRTREGLTVRQLAEKAGVDKNTIVRLERGQISYNTLCSVCRALGVSVAAMLRPEPDENSSVAINRSVDRVWWPYQNQCRPVPTEATEVNPRSGDNAFVDADERGFSWVVHNKLAGGQLKISLVKLYTEGRTKLHKGEEMLYVLQGRCRLKVGGSEFLLDEGDVAQFWSTEAHSFAPADERNTEDVPVVLLSVGVDPPQQDGS